MAATQAAITVGDRGFLLNIVAWVALISVSFATLIKVAVKFCRIHRLEWDDFYMLGAMMTAVAQTTAVTDQVKSGLRRHMAELSKLQVQATERTAYISEFSYIVSICLARMAVLHFLKTIALSKTRSALTKWVTCFNVVWAVAAVMQKVTFWNVIGSVDITLDVTMVTLPPLLLDRVQISWSRKIRLLSTFATRLLIPPLTSLRLFYFTKTSKLPDHTYNSINTSIITQLAMNLSVIVACVPFFKPVLDDVQSGLLGGLRIKIAARSSPSNSTENILQILPRTRRRPGDKFLPIADFDTETIITGGKRSAESLTSHSNSIGSDEMIIKQTTSFTVHSEHNRHDVQTLS
ncbi:MAG: hypothetical protein ASARMPRED_008324 [Alectoria sarmentosa]|nr:MAG: hypothetical protein ASARMPRED_008324 [Alectoria sarmentosa]